MDIISDTLFSPEEKFRDYVNERWYIKSDAAHRIDHIDDVWSNYCYLVNENRIRGLDRKIIFLAVYMHDIFTGENRDIHNELASKFVLNSWRTKEKELLNLRECKESEIKLIADMVYWHRSSLVFNPKKFKKQEAEYITIIRAADKGAPIFSEWLVRTMKYHEHDKDPIKNARKFFIDKYGENGYAWKNDPTYKELYITHYDKFQEDLNEWLEETK